MNIHFNYFITKYIANCAGFTDNESQFIAEVSQFISENTDKETEFFKDKVPAEIIERKLCEKTEDGYKVMFPKTALNSESDIETLKNQKEGEKLSFSYLIPFEYLPNEVLDNRQYINQYQVSAIENINNHRVFTPLLNDCVNLYNSGEDNIDSNEELAKVIYVGALAHVIGSSYCNEYLNGFNIWVNDVEIQRVQDDTTLSDLTDKYKKSSLANMPKVGAYRLGDVADDFNIDYIYYQAADQNDSIRTRTHTLRNNSTFLKAAKSMYNFMMQVTKKQDKGDRGWNGTYKPLLQEMLKKTEKNKDSLCQLWKEKTGLSFSYDSTEVMKKLKENEEFFYAFIIAVDKLRKSFKKTENKDMEKKPTCLEQKEESDQKDQIKITSIEFFDDTCKMEIVGNYKKTMKFINLKITIFDEDGEQVPCDGENKKELDSDRVSTTVTCKMSEVKNGKITVQAVMTNDEVTTDYGKVRNSFGFFVPNLSSMFDFTVNAPKKTQKNEKNIVVLNNLKVTNGDYSFEKNAGYTAQDNNDKLDIYLPIDLQLKCCEEYGIKEIVEIKTWLLDEEEKRYYHCGNGQFNDISFDKETGILGIKYADEWKNQFYLNDFDKDCALLTLNLSLVASLTATNADNIDDARITVQWDTSCLAGTGFKKILERWSEIKC